MTDQRALAEQHVEKRMNALLLYQEILTDSPPDAVTRIVAALADERRRVWEEAAKECDQRLFNCQRVLDTRGYRMFQPGELAVWRANADLLRRLAEWIRAKAHAGQEG